MNTSFFYLLLLFFNKTFLKRIIVNKKKLNIKWHNSFILIDSIVIKKTFLYICKNLNSTKNQWIRHQIGILKNQTRMELQQNRMTNIKC